MFKFETEASSDIEVLVQENMCHEHLREYIFTFVQKKEKVFDPVTIIWKYPLIDAHYYWMPNNAQLRKLRADYHVGQISKATVCAPVGIFYSSNERNRLTCALSDPLNPIELAMGVREENGFIVCKATFFKEPTKRMKKYSVTLRIDTRDILYYEALGEVATWWEGYPLLKPSMVPKDAKKPMYSTWYSFHQMMTDVSIEAQLKEAKRLGCEAIIVDDGWQTDNNERGYAFTGDWEVCEEKFPDMKKHVKRVHDLGLKYLLWYSVPYIGVKSKVWNRFKDKTLYLTERNSSATLDPRYKEVREYLINIYEKALEEWDLDGFKLDFVDRFGTVTSANIPEANSEMDYKSIEEAVDALLSDVINRLRRIKPSIMIEFRQKYIGPLMRKYGNIFRVGDCPADFATNRQGICDIRLLAKETVAHSDMIMWYDQDKVESAALQINNVIFGVPQISMDLLKLSNEHSEMLEFWLGFYLKHKETLLEGAFMPHHPEQMYPLIEAKSARSHIVGVYADTVPLIQPAEGETIIINGKLTESLYLKVQEDFHGNMIILDCLGKEQYKSLVSFNKGIIELSVPASGLVYLNPND